MKDDKILYSFTWMEEFPSIEKLEKEFNLSKDMIDADFGIVEIDEEEKLYCILISKDAIPQGKDKVEGQEHSNPRIAPFGLEEE